MNRIFETISAEAIIPAPPVQSNHLPDGEYRVRERAWTRIRSWCA